MSCSFTPKRILKGRAVSAESIHYLLRGSIAIEKRMSRIIEKPERSGFQGALLRVFSASSQSPGSRETRAHQPARVILNHLRDYRDQLLAPGTLLAKHHAVTLGRHVPDLLPFFGASIPQMHTGLSRIDRLRSIRERPVCIWGIDAPKNGSKSGTCLPKVTAWCLARSVPGARSWSR